MRIVVLLKQSFRGETLEFQEKSYRRKTRDEELELNYDDGNSLEAALQFSENFDGSLEMIGLTMGPEKSEEILRQAIALGFHRGIRVTDPLLEGADVSITATVLAKVIEKIGPVDFVFAGEKSQDGKTGSVGPMVADHLQVSHISGIVHFEKKNRVLKVIEEKENRQRTIEIEMPCLLMLKRKKQELRNMTMMGIRRSMEKEIQVFSLSDLFSPTEYPQSKTAVQAIFFRKNSRQKELFFFREKEESPRGAGSSFRDVIKKIRKRRQEIL